MKRKLFVAVACVIVAVAFSMAGWQIGWRTFYKPYAGLRLVPGTMMAEVESEPGADAIPESPRVAEDLPAQ